MTRDLAGGPDVSTTISGADGDAAARTREVRAGRVNLRVQSACAWSGVAFLALFMFGWIWLADMVPPPDPSAAPEVIKAYFMTDLTTKRIGLLLAMSVWGLLIPWGIALAAQTRRAEGGFPILTLIQIACATSTAALGVLMLMIWGVAAFRPDELAAGTTRMLNDLGWFIFLIDWAPVTIWLWALGLAILLDHNAVPAFPRWSAWFCFWVGLIFFPAGLIIFFKTGPFAFDGALAFYLPAGVFFLWFAVMTALLIRTLRAQLAGSRWRAG
jgi:hypothetical protein